jgi:uncharacterized 2Fe-2S/4Fe-4S cluster protein (DUF4445 family)
MAVQVTINGRPIAAEAGATLFALAEQTGVAVPTSCRSQGKCKECIVEVEQGAELLSPPTEAEQHLRGAFRLSCQCRVASGEGSIQCHTMRRGHMRIERGATGIATLMPNEFDPAVRRLENRVLFDGVEIDFCPESVGIYGLAMDLGTTTIVLRLYDLESGRLVADSCFENPQRFGGSDVMARIEYDTRHGKKLLRRTLAGYLTRAIEEFPVDPRSIYEAVVVGNSTMRDLFFGLSVHSIGQSPYQSITEIEMATGLRASTSLSATPRECLLPIHPRGRVYGGPIISGHIGADAAACMLAVDVAGSERLVAIMDIGTNTELILGNCERILAASCPAGPAFEGGAIACGMPGLEGAIESVGRRADGSLQLGVIGDGPAAGICGSGLVELLSELVRAELMNDLGRFEESTRIVLDERAGIYFLESDASELAQAKGANVAGLHTLFHGYGAAFDDVERFYLAGGFGRRLNIAAAKRIGLIPNIPDDRIVQVGNAAIEGASLALLSMPKRAELEQLVKRVEHCRLETHPRFFDFFVDGCQFKPLDHAAAMAF